MSTVVCQAQVCGVVLLREDGAALLQHRDDIPGIADPGKAHYGPPVPDPPRRGHRDPAGRWLPHQLTATSSGRTRRPRPRFCVSCPSVIMRTNAADMAVQLAEERNEQHRPDDDRRTPRSARSA